MRNKLFCDNMAIDEHCLLCFWLLIHAGYHELRSSTKRLFLYLTIESENSILPGAISKSRNAINSFVMSVCMSVRPRWTSLLPPDGFSLNLILCLLDRASSSWSIFIQLLNLILRFFRANLLRKLNFHEIRTRITGTSHEDLCASLSSS